MPFGTEDKESLLVEYEAAQDSAQFHDGLVWQVTNVLWVAALIVFGFILTQIGTPKLKVILTLLSVLGISFVLFAWFSALQLEYIKIHKYRRCKEIEEILGLKQHRTLKFPRYYQRIIYGLIIILFVTIWVAVLGYIWFKVPV